MEIRNKTNKIKAIASAYLSLMRIFCSEGFHLKSSYSNSYTSFCANVEIAFMSLPIPLKRIINNDFFYQDYPGWWKLSYSKHKYLKLKELAIDKFLEAYYEIN